ncbi:hypothetical protein FF38_08617 [Lucilia cuprina]|uniref:Uncharacterized protein n=1 Tax=Lucilia cuprina TaxID=7375 RepID=A0A0L0C2P6_LUCCU|nr:hypothetical protein FF38_08617 [Lucilia cuprina]
MEKLWCNQNQEKIKKILGHWCIRERINSNKDFNYVIQTMIYDLKPHFAVLCENIYKISTRKTRFGDFIIIMDCAIKLERRRFGLNGISVVTFKKLRVVSGGDDVSVDVDVSARAVADSASLSIVVVVNAGDDDDGIAVENVVVVGGVMVVVLVSPLLVVVGILVVVVMMMLVEEKEVSVDFTSFCGVVVVIGLTVVVVVILELGVVSVAGVLVFCVSSSLVVADDVTSISVLLFGKVVSSLSWVLVETADAVVVETTVCIVVAVIVVCISSKCKFLEFLRCSVSVVCCSVIGFILLSLSVVVVIAAVFCSSCLVVAIGFSLSVLLLAEVSKVFNVVFSKSNTLGVVTVITLSELWSLSEFDYPHDAVLLVGDGVGDVHVHCDHFLQPTCLPLHIVLNKPSSWQFLINSILAVSAIYCKVKFGMSFKLQASAQVGTTKRKP